MQTDIESACLGLNHIAERLGLSRRTIDRIIARGELPTLKIGRRRLVRLADLRRWLAGYETPMAGDDATNIGRQFAIR